MPPVAALGIEAQAAVLRRERLARSGQAISRPRLSGPVEGAVEDPERGLVVAGRPRAQQREDARALTAAEDRLDLTGLAERTALQVPSASRIIANLEGRGLVERRTTKGDQRRASLGLSDAGRGLVRRIAPHSEAAYNRIEEEFGAERLANLLDELADLAALSATEKAQAS